MTMTLEQTTAHAPNPILVSAIQAIAARCDGASSNDGQGFNGTDSKFGKKLASTPPEVWTPALQRKAWVMLHKYQGQLVKSGIDYTAIPEPPEARGADDIRCIDVRGGKVLVFLPYGDIAYPKSGLGAIWNRDLRGWQVSVAKYGSVVTWAGRYNVPITDRAMAILNEVDTSANPAEPAGHAFISEGSIALRFDYNPNIVDAVRTIPNRRWDSAKKLWLVSKECVSFVRKIAEEYNITLTDEVKDLPDVDMGNGSVVSVHERNFALSFPYDAQTISLVRQMPGSSWNPSKRAWLVPIEAADEVLAFVSQQGAVVTPDAMALLKEAADVRDIIASSSANDAELVIEGFGKPNLQLFPYQRAGVRYAMRAMGFEYADGKFTKVREGNEGVLIGDEMGLGKTPQGLGVLKAANAFPAVVVVPASLKINWKREAEKWIDGVRVAVLSGTSGNLPDADIYVVNYDVLDHWYSKFGNIKGLVLDESHYIKNGSTIRAKACISLSEKVTDDGVRVCLSGTAIVNQPLELMTQLKVLNRLGDFGGSSQFRNTYGRSNARTLASLNRKLRATCYVRRRKADVLTELPPKMWSEVLIEGDKNIMKEYKKAEADIVKYLSEEALRIARESGASDKEAQNEAWQRALRARGAEHLVSISTLKQLAAKAKMKAAEQWIQDFLAQDKKLVVFGWHTEVVDMVADNFAGNCKIQGGVSMKKRQEAVDAFQQSDDQKVIACQIKAAGVGLTLTAASDVLFIEQGWTPADMEQAVDRCHRIGQTDSVTGWLMLTQNTIDEDIAALIERKRGIVNRAIDGSDDDEQEDNSLLGDLIVALAQRGMAQ